MGWLAHILWDFEIVGVDYDLYHVIRSCETTIEDGPEHPMISDWVE